jgi:hypothetical protein
LFLSTTYKLPLKSIVIPVGFQNFAIPDEPSKKPELPSPATVETFPETSILRIL